MPQTQDTLILAALQEVGRVGEGQTPSAEDVAVVTPRIGPMLAEIASRRITTGTVDPTNIPDALFPGLVMVLAQHMAAWAGKGRDDKALAAAELRLRELARLDRTEVIPLVQQVLEQLEIYGAGANTLDAQAVTDRLPGILGELAIRNVVLEQDPANIDPAVMPDLSRYIAASLATPQAVAVMNDATMRLRALRPEETPYPRVRMQCW